MSDNIEKPEAAQKIENNQEGQIIYHDEVQQKPPFFLLRWFRKRPIPTAAGIIAIIVIIAGLAFFYKMTRGLPPIEALRDYQQSLITNIYSDNNKVLGQYYIERRRPVSLSRMPRHLKEAVIAVEDSRFYQHGALDYFGIARALVTNILTGEIRQGGSTITQQLARSLFLSRERSLERKLKEAILARRLEKLYTKDDILEFYLNQIYFGHGAYGIQSAANTYFGRDIEDITLHEAAFLSGLPKAPADYSPYHNPEKAKQRQEVVLKRMVEEKYLSEKDYQDAYKKPLVFEKRKKDKEIAPYFLEYVRQYLEANYGSDMIYRGGMNVYTTANYDMQEAATRALRHGLRELDKRQGFRGPIGHRPPDEVQDIKKGKEAKGMIIPPPDFGKDELLDATVIAVGNEGATVDTRSLKGRILFDDMKWARRRLLDPNDVEKFKYSEKAKPPDILKVGDIVKVAVKGVDAKTKETLFVLEQEPIVEGALLAIDPRTGAIKAMAGGYDFEKSKFNRAIQAKRQPGSAFKPIIYATAIDMGFSPSTILVDAPIVYEDPTLEKDWKPLNYDEKFHGFISMRSALAYSRNVATIRLLEKVGTRGVIDFAQRVGIKNPLANDLSVALGSSSVTLHELTSVFGIFANQGTKAESMSIKMITTKEGKVLLEETEAKSESVLSKETAYLITNMLEDVIQYGTGQRAKVLGRQMAGKTGTTNEFTDAWFMGYTPNLVVGVWVGYDDRKSLGHGEAGARAALPIWIEFMKTALNQIPEESFTIPEEIVFTRVDPENGLLASDNTKNPVIEVFKRGSEPTKSADASKPTQFFRMD